MKIIEIRTMIIIFINKSLKARQIEYKMATWLQIMKTKTEVARKNKRKKMKKRTVLNLLLFYYNFSLRRGLGLWDSSLRGSLACAFKVTIGRN